MADINEDNDTARAAKISGYDIASKKFSEIHAEVHPDHKEKRRREEGFENCAGGHIG